MFMIFDKYLLAFVAYYYNLNIDLPIVLSTVDLAISFTEITRGASMIKFFIILVCLSGIGLAVV